MINAFNNVRFVELLYCCEQSIPVVNKEITRNLYSWNSFKARNLGKGLFGGTLSQQDFVINESQNANALPPKRLQFS
jgi:hypothetical protein